MNTYQGGNSNPTDDAVFKLFYRALNNISQKWTMPLRDWKAALNRFTIQFTSVCHASNSTAVYTKFGTPFLNFGSKSKNLLNTYDACDEPDTYPLVQRCP